MRVRAAVFMGLSVVFSVFAYGTNGRAAQGIQGSPKIINVFLNWQLPEEDLPRLAQWDIVVLDADQQARYPDRVRRLRLLNPSIKILAYVPTEEIADARYTEPPEYPFAKLAARIQERWIVRDASGNVASYWPETSLLNVTDIGHPSASGERWNEFFPRFIRDEILSTGLWDGVFLDNTFDGISYFSRSPVDLDRDGRADPPSIADAAWRDGMRKMLRTLHEQNPRALLMGNGGAVYADQLHGAFFEHFPSTMWADQWKQFRDAILRNIKPSISSLNVNTDNADRPTDVRLMRFGLGSALLGGGYSSFDRGDRHHDVLWWYDEYAVPLGAPLGEPRRLDDQASSPIAPGVWGRAFEQGFVVVNSAKTARRVVLPGVFEKIRGTQDPITNDGAVVSSVDLEAEDGLILRRRFDAMDIRKAVFTNGRFVRIYGADGAQMQQGFFAQREDVPNGASVVSIDVDADGSPELITAERGAITVRNTEKKSSFTIFPFDSSYRGALSFTVADIDATPGLELVVAREGALRVVNIFSSDGKKLTKWNVVPSSGGNGVRVASGDVDHDGITDIVTGTGPGGRPMVRMWNKDGKEMGKGFYAFDRTERGGVNVAVGDIDGDGIQEILAGSGQGTIPRIRIFDANGRMKTEWSFGSTPLPNGLELSTSDVNNDGKDEVIVSGFSLF